MLFYHFSDGIINCQVEINKAAQWTVSNFGMIRPGINTATSATVITCVKIVLRKVEFCVTTNKPNSGEEENTVPLVCQK